MSFWERLFPRHTKFHTADDEGQRLLAKHFWRKHDAVLFTAPTSEPHLLGIVRKRQDVDAHHLGYFDGSLLDVIPDTPANRGVRERLSANFHTEAKPEPPSSFLSHVIAWVTAIFTRPTQPTALRSPPNKDRLDTATIELLQRSSMDAWLSGDFLGRLGLESNTAARATARFEGAYSTPLAYSIFDLLVDLRAVGEFDISKYQGEKFLTFVTRLYYADKYHFDFRHKDEIKGQVAADGASTGAMAGVRVGGQVNAADSQANASIAVYDNTDKTKDPIAFAARMLRVKAVPNKDNPNMAAFKVDTPNPRAAAIDHFTDVTELTAETIEELVEDGDACLLSAYAIGCQAYDTDETTVLHSLDVALDENVCHTLDPKDQTYRLDVENENSLTAWCAIL